MIPERTPLSETVDLAKMRSFYGRHRVRSRDILDKPQDIPTSEGTRQRGFGVPHQGRRLRRIQNWRGGEERTEKKAPTGPERASYRRRSFLGNSVIPPRLPLLIDWLEEG